MSIRNTIVHRRNASLKLTSVGVFQNTSSIDNWQFKFKVEDRGGNTILLLDQLESFDITSEFDEETGAMTVTLITVVKDTENWPLGKHKAEFMVINQDGCKETIPSFILEVDDGLNTGVSDG